jgi:SAM-dependent methyltransferase
MTKDSIYRCGQYIQKIINTFVPAPVFQLSPWKNWATMHWGEQDLGDVHGYHHYCTYQPRIPVLVNELNTRVSMKSSILDLGCNCGFYVSTLKKEGYENLSGIDISKNAIEYGKKNFDMEGIDLTADSFQEALPRAVAKNIRYDVVYSMGATIELVHPSFDIVKFICLCAKEYVILNIFEWGHDYPRFWEYEFNRHGFFLVKCIRPYNGAELDKTIENIDSFLVFKRIKGN